MAPGSLGRVLMSIGPGLVASAPWQGGFGSDDHGPQATLVHQTHDLIRLEPRTDRGGNGPKAR